MRTTCSRFSAQRMMKAPTMKALATATGLNSVALISLPKIRPSTASGRKAMPMLSTKRCATGIAAQAGDHAAEACAVLPADRQHGGGLDHDQEQLAAFVIELQQVAGEDQVSRRGHRQEFGEAFDQAQDQGLEQGMEIHVRGMRGGRRRRRRRPRSLARGRIGLQPRQPVQRVFAALAAHLGRGLQAAATRRPALAAEQRAAVVRSQVHDTRRRRVCPAC
jgi:hypothetical protein